MLNRKIITNIEIFILIVNIFAVAYIISGFDLISAQTNEGAMNVCCEKTKNGNICQNDLPSNCDINFKQVPTRCENTDFCQVGCCMSNTNGMCSKRTSKSECERSNGTFFSNADCNVQECKKGCCILGSEAKWTTEKNCKFESNSQNKDIPTDWRYDEQTNSELKCLFSVRKNEKSACVYKSGNEKKCIFTTLEDCIARTGSESNFAHNITFCSNPILNTTCKAKDHKGCLENKEDVYWFDSCNNPEDVAEDCSLTEGNYCGKDNNEYKCKSINCVVDGKVRKNGESWCEYDGAIGVSEVNNVNKKEGYGRDPVGSRHVRHVCYMGSERIEPCADYRNEICVQEDTQVGNGETFSQAACRVNNWRRCLEINTKKQTANASMELCKKNPDCFVKEIDMGGSFHFSVCLPAYPPGFNLNEDYNLTSGGLEVPDTSGTICSIATQRCTETWICGIFGCICVDNCKCHTSYFTEKMNEFCVSLGDCGAYVNYVGEYSDGNYGLRSTCDSRTCGKGPPRLQKSILEAFKKNVGPQIGQKPAKPGDYEFFQTINPEALKEIKEEDHNLSAFQKELLEVSGSMGSPYLLKLFSKEGNESLSEEEIGRINSRPVNFASYFNSFSSVKSAISSQIIKKETKAGGFEMLAAFIAGAIAYLITQSIIMAMIAAMLAYLFAIAFVVYVDIDFICDKWEVPTGGKDCNKCNNQETPCTEYRCQSLGTLCKFINKGTPDELCTSVPENSSIPKISPLYSVINKNYEYYNVNENGFEIVKSDTKGCVDAYSNVRIGIKIEPFAKCKFGTDPKQSYEEMPEFFGLRGSSILPVHQIDLFFPSPEALKNKYNLTEDQIKELGKIDLYVKCKTASGKTNFEPYHIKACINPGPDLTPPVILKTDPNKNSFVKYNEDKQDLIVYVNEPSECKWSREDKEDFNSMENSFDCEKDIRQYTIYGLTCKTNLTGLKNNTRFYIKCRDTSENKNVMKENYEYELSVSNSNLVIEEIKPKNGENIISGVEPVSFKLRLRTSGGAENGVSICRWEGNGYSDQFTETNSSYHSYEIGSATQGKYNISFFCEDVAGNFAVNSTSFKISIDKFGPQITRVYYDGGLKIITNENAECRYSFDKKLEFENFSVMYGEELEHSASWQSKNYVIQCKDEYGNKGNKIFIKPYGYLY